jgi:hypothetical protein
MATVEHWHHQSEIQRELEWHSLMPRLFGLFQKLRTSAYAVIVSVTAAWATWKCTGSIGRRRHQGDEGSIGEWVMILVMAVGITLFIWAIAQPMLGSILRRALGKLFR